MHNLYISLTNSLGKSLEIVENVFYIKNKKNYKRINTKEQRNASMRLTKKSKLRGHTQHAYGCIPLFITMAYIFICF